MRRDSLDAVSSVLLAAASGSALAAVGACSAALLWARAAPRCRCLGGRRAALCAENPARPFRSGRRIGARASAASDEAEEAQELQRDDDSLQWLPLEGLSEEGEAAPSEELSPPASRARTLPVFLANDVFMPAAQVSLKLASPAECRLYEDLLLAGGRLLLSTLRRDGPEAQAAAFGTLLYLEDLREVSGATDGAAKYVAEHRAVGRARLLQLERRAAGSDAEHLVGKVELLEDKLQAAEPPSEALAPQLGELAALQKRAGGARQGEASAAELAAALAAPPPAPPLLPVQGLWRAASGVRVRVDGAAAVGLGRLEAEGDEVVLRFGSGGTREFRARAEGSEEAGSPAVALRWDDGDVWTRIASPPPYCFDPFGAAGALWRAARRWRELGAWRAEAKRGEARFRSAEAIAQSLEGSPSADPVARRRAEAEAAEAWQRAALGADAAAASMRWEEVLQPCQRLLEAETHAARLEAFRAILAVEAAKLQLRLALEESSSSPGAAAANEAAG
uniref:Uncharacterized protein n=1 Tax=Alexandrium monilatum TaxID=311494 RepID=A0A7S4QI51_9DINO